MGGISTQQRLSELNDAGLFERIATAVLRQSEPGLRSLIHSGVNAAGRTIAGPLDGITFVEGASPPHMVSIQHTISPRKKMREKWLADPDQSGSSVEPGDFVKTAAIVRKEKARHENLRATLFLTCSHEPPDELVRDAHARAIEEGIELRFRTGSQLAHFLDTDPDGQWIRKQYLGTSEERLSSGLLSELSQRSIEAASLLDNPNAWIERTADHDLARAAARQVSLIVGESGIGKSVACNKRLRTHIDNGGYGLVVPQELLTAEYTLSLAIAALLRQLHPSLTIRCGDEALSLATESRSLLLVVEDIGRSSQPAALLGRMINWSHSAPEDAPKGNWQILCPVWPQLLSMLDVAQQRRANSLTVHIEVFDNDEGARAVLSRHRLLGVKTTPLQAGSISSALGNDPLLIALHDPETAPEAAHLIRHFIGSNLRRAETVGGRFTATELSQSLRQLGTAMIQNRSIEPTWNDLGDWFAEDTSAIAMLRELAGQGAVFRLVGPADNQRITFRHDRVRDYILIEVFGVALGDEVPPSWLTEPFFAKQLGETLALKHASILEVKRVQDLNPLALFHALRCASSASEPAAATVLLAIQDWLSEESTHEPQHRQLREAALRTLAQTDSKSVLEIAARFSGFSWSSLRAKFRNGSVAAGIELCSHFEPGSNFAGHTQLVEHVLAQPGGTLIADLTEALSQGKQRSGALRLAGDIGDSRLVEGLVVCWEQDADTTPNLADYLYAAGKCAGEDAARLLGLVCDAWSALEEKARYDLATHHVRWAFHRQLPEPALHYLIDRSSDELLRWPITDVLDGVDHPDAVEFVANEVATINARLAGTRKFSPFTISIDDIWRRRRDEQGVPMSYASRSRLQALWENRENSDHLRRAAFKLWAPSVEDGDLPMLAAIDGDDVLCDAALSARLRHGDRAAISQLLLILQQDGNTHMWWHARHVWDRQLYDELDRQLSNRRESADATWSFDDNYLIDGSVYSLLMRMPVVDARALLNAHWDHLRYSPYFVQTALYLATTELTKLADEAVVTCPKPQELFKHLSMHWGIKETGHPGVSRIDQLRALIPHLDHLDSGCLYAVWGLCNDRGWFDFRRQHLEARVDRKYRDVGYVSDAGAMAALDELLESDRPHWADFWVESFRRVGVSSDHIVEVLARWLAAQTDERALQVAADAALALGERRHLVALQPSFCAMDKDPDSLYDNVAFALQLKSLT